MPKIGQGLTQNRRRIAAETTGTGHRSALEGLGNSLQASEWPTAEAQEAHHMSQYLLAVTFETQTKKQDHVSSISTPAHAYPRRLMLISQKKHPSLHAHLA